MEEVSDGGEQIVFAGSARPRPARRVRPPSPGAGRDSGSRIGIRARPGPAHGAAAKDRRRPIRVALTRLALHARYQATRMPALPPTPAVSYTHLTLPTI